MDFTCISPCTFQSIASDQVSLADVDDDIDNMDALFATHRVRTNLLAASQNSQLVSKFVMQPP